MCVSEDSHENDAVDAPHECKTLKAKPEFMRDLKDAGDHYDTVKSRKKKEPKSYNVELQGEGEKQGGGGGGAENADVSFRFYFKFILVGNCPVAKQTIVALFTIFASGM